MGKYHEPIANMGSLPTNVTLHGRSVHRSADIPGHNVFRGYSEWENNGHVGVGDAVDLNVAGRTEVYAIADGVQTRWHADTTTKEYIYLEGDGWSATYAHINAVLEGENLPVTKGQLVGRVRSDLSSPHLHFELWMGGVAVHAPQPAQLRDLIRAKLGLTTHARRPGDPRLTLARPTDDRSAPDGLAYIEAPSRWNHEANAVEVDTQALAAWLGADPAGLPEFEEVRVVLDRWGIAATFDLSQLLSAADPRIHVSVRR
jgi:hypothetical protein